MLVSNNASKHPDWLLPESPWAPSLMTTEGVRVACTRLRGLCLHGTLMGLQIFLIKFGDGPRTTFAARLGRGPREEDKVRTPPVSSPSLCLSSRLCVLALCRY